MVIAIGSLNVIVSVDLALLPHVLFAVTSISPPVAIAATSNVALAPVPVIVTPVPVYVHV